MTRKLMQVVLMVGLVWGFASSARSAAVASRSMDIGCVDDGGSCDQVGQTCPLMGGECGFDPQDPLNCTCLCLPGPC